MRIRYTASPKLKKTASSLRYAILAIVITAASGCSPQPAGLASASVSPRTGPVVSATAPSVTAASAATSPSPAAASPAPSALKPAAAALSSGTGRLFDATIVKVVDGDTMDVQFDGKKERIRLLLVDTPETVDPAKPVQPFGPEASKFAHETLDNKQVRLELDVSDRDKYGRLLCYLWLGDNMFNEMLLEKGLARVAYVYPPNVKYVDRFREVQKKPQAAGLGIWSLENYAQEDGFHEDKATASVKPAAKTAPPAKAQPTVAPTSKPAGGTVYYKNCTEAKAAGAAPIHVGEPGYGKHLDRDGDGIACEK